MSSCLAPSYGYSLTEAASLLKISVSTLHRWRKPGVKLSNGDRLALQARRLGGTWRVTREDLDAFVDRLTADRSGEPGARSAPSKTRRAHEIDRAARTLSSAGF